MPIAVRSKLLQKAPLLLERVDEAARNSLLAYVRACDPDYVASDLHRLLTRLLESIEDGRCKRLIVTVPPRHGKSRLTSVELTSWMLGRNPKAKIILASYSSALAQFHSREVRDRLNEHPDYRRMFGTRLKRDARSSVDWLTSAGGQFLAAGVGSGVTGRGADLIVVDDPFKDYQEAHSATQRETVWHWYLSTLYTRLAPGGRIVIIMTRWHTDDLVGRLMDPVRAEEIREAGGEEIPWQLVNLPALSHGVGDLLGRPEGSPLFPERFPRSWLLTQRAVLGTYLFSALYDGNPVPKGGNYVNAGNFLVVPREQAPAGRRMVRYWDLAATDKEKSDFTAGAWGCLDEHANLWVFNITKGQWRWPEARNRIAAIAMTERNEVGVEAQAGFKTAADNLREVLPADIMLRQTTVDRDKLVRALPWFALTDARKVYLVDGPWVRDFKTECEAFPSGAHDDQVDAVSGLYRMLRSGGLLLA